MKTYRFLVGISRNGDQFIASAIDFHGVHVRIASTEGQAIENARIAIANAVNSLIARGEELPWCGYIVPDTTKTTWVTVTVGGRGKPHHADHAMAIDDRHYVTLDSKERWFFENTKTQFVYRVHNLGPSAIKITISDEPRTLPIGETVEVSPPIGERVIACATETGREGLVWYEQISPPPSANVVPAPAARERWRNVAS